MFENAIGFREENGTASVSEGRDGVCVSVCMSDGEQGHMCTLVCALSQQEQYSVAQRKATIRRLQKRENCAQLVEDVEIQGENAA